MRGPSPKTGSGHTHPVRVDKLAFPLALLEQNLRILRLANLRFALRNASFLQLSKNSSRIASRISAPGGAPHWFGAAAAKRPNLIGANKKPGVKRRASPPANLAGGIARCSTAFYPVFVPNLTSMLQGRFPVSRGLRAHRPVIRHLSSIRIFPYTSSRMRRIFREFPPPRLWISPSHVEFFNHGQALMVLKNLTWETRFLASSSMAG